MVLRLPDVSPTLCFPKNVYRRGFPPHDKDPIYLRFSICSVSARSELSFRFTTEPAIANAAHTHTRALTHTSEGRCHMLTQHQHDQLFQMTTQRPDGSGCSDQTV